MKNPIYAAVIFLCAIGAVSAAESKCVPLKPAETKVWEASNDHNGRTLYRRWGIDLTTMSEERIVMNSDSTVRSRTITTYQGGKQSVVIVYKGMTEPWFTERWSWGTEGGYSVERRSIAGELIVRQIFPPDNNGLVQTLDSNGNQLTPERYKELSDEIGDLLF